LLLLAALAQNERGVSPEEARKRLDEAFADAEKASKKWRAWTATIRTAEVDENEQRNYNGRVWVKNGKLFADVKRTKEMNGGDVLDTIRKLGVSLDLDIAVESEKILYRYDLSVLDDFLPELLIRDGFSKALEERFVVELVQNPRYDKTEPTDEDLKHLGITRKQWEDWKKGRYDFVPKGSGGSASPLKTEIDPHADRRREFEKDPAGGASLSVSYLARLTPKNPKLAGKCRRIQFRFHPLTFVPLHVTTTDRDGIDRNLVFGDAELDPKDEIPDNLFRIDSTGYTTRWPQKE
jgi:hypothetical protein